MPGVHPANPKREIGRSFIKRVSLAWLLPLFAIAFAIALLWQNIVERGPLVRIQFAEAGGVIAGQTRIRRNDVDVGTVEAVQLADNLNSVVIEARLDPLVAPFIDADTRFWIVNARVNTTEISGLSTLLSGSYIGIDWDEVEGEPQREFVGLEEQPLTPRGTPGRRLTLTSEEAGYVYVGSPVFFRQIEVGRVERRRLSSDATQVLFDIFIEEPYHLHIYPESRFFSVSGLEGNLGADGISVRVESISAFFTGGIGFSNPANVGDLEPLERDGARFRMYDGRKAAQESIFQGEEDERFRFQARFQGSVKGLRRDAPIEYNGIRIGRVADVSIIMPSNAGDPPEAVATLQLQPRQLGFDSVSRDALLAGLDRLIAGGLRVQLASGNLLTGTLIVKLVTDSSAPAANLIRDAEPFPEIPTTASNIEAVTRDVEQLVSQLASLPLDELVGSATGLFADLRALVSSPEVGGLPASLAESLDSLARTVEGVESAVTGLPALVEALTEASRNADDVLQGLSPDSEIYIELSSTARELRAAARSIADFARVLEENPNAVFTGR
jgi:paraquat-inducible protein B